MISSNQIYTFIRGKLLAKYPDIYITSFLEPIPKTFPAVMLRLSGDPTPVSGMTLDGDDEIHRFTFEVHVVVNGTLYTAYEIMNEVEAAFKELKFRKSQSSPVNNSDILVFRLRANFTRLVGAGDPLPI